MALVNNCNIPEDLFYVIDKHVWARVDGDLVTVGESQFRFLETMAH